MTITPGEKKTRWKKNKLKVGGFYRDRAVEKLNPFHNPDKQPDHYRIIDFKDGFYKYAIWYIREKELVGAIRTCVAWMLEDKDLCEISKLKKDMKLSKLDDPFK